jgi:hypothetical protein
MGDFFEEVRKMPRLYLEPIYLTDVNANCVIGAIIDSPTSCSPAPAPSPTLAPTTPSPTTSSPTTSSPTTSSPTTSEPTQEPTISPTLSSTDFPTVYPTISPTLSPTTLPTTGSPTHLPTNAPTPPCPKLNINLFCGDFPIPEEQIALGIDGSICSACVLSGGTCKLVLN